jgi:hypothetical protein
MENIESLPPRVRFCNPATPTNLFHHRLQGGGFFFCSSRPKPYALVRVRAGKKITQRSEVNGKY